MEHKSDKKKDRWIILLACIAFFSAGVAVWAVRTRTAPPVLAPDQIPEAEVHAEQIPDDDQNGSVSTSGNRVTLTYSDQVLIDLSKETAVLTYANPAKSTHAVVLQLVVQEEVLLQSGAIAPGVQVSELELLPNIARRLQEGQYEGLLRAIFYAPESGEKANLDADIPVVITVKH